MEKSTIDFLTNLLKEADNALTEEVLRQAEQNGGDMDAEILDTFKALKAAQADFRQWVRDTAFNEGLESGSEEDDERSDD